ncbi:hypothetical protein NHJ13734_003176 [Beauveria thailandica]
MTANIHLMRDPCWTCRRRTIQCDRSCVPCFKCKKAGLKCLDKRPLRWVKGVAVRGKMRGRIFGGVAGDIDEAHCLISAQPWRSSVWTDFVKRAAAERSPPLPLQDPCMASLDRQSRFYIDYSSIISLAARHYANTGLFFDATGAHRSPRFSKAQLDALRFKGQVIKALSEFMSRPSSRNKDATMATILLLIFIDIVDSGIDGWSFHIRGFKALYQSIAQSNSHGNDEMDRGEAALELRIFIVRQLSLRHDDADMSGHVQDTIAMLELANGFDCFAWASSCQQPRAPSPAKTNHLFMLAQAYKCATLLYGRQALGAETWDDEHLLSQLLELAEFLQHDATLFKCLLWPIFIAGLASKAHHQQDAVTESLRRLWDLTNCLNVIGASKILRNFWGKNKQAGDQMRAMPKLEGLAHGWLLI